MGTAPSAGIPEGPAAHPQAKPTYTPKVAGVWYYLYLSPAGNFAVSANQPTFNTTYFGYYHPSVANHRAIGKFYVG